MNEYRQYVAGMNDPPPAVVVGLCAHGLACVRALSRAGIRVYALEADPDLPGFQTRRARVVLTDEINGPGVVPGLRELARTHLNGEEAVLFLTNDNMVRHVGNNWSELAGMYRLSWSGQRDEVRRLLSKTEIEAHCRNAGLQYPETVYIQDADELETMTVNGTRFPAVVKPSTPLSGFKAFRIESFTELMALRESFGADYPLVVQNCVAGDDRAIWFVAMYLRDGEPVSSFVGRKIASHPPAMGQTTAAESAHHPELLNLARKFFSHGKINGPVSLEFKIDENGVPWVIEPTVGRTDYWLDCCIANRVDFPLMEYLSEAGGTVPEFRQANRRIWLDAERDPRILVRVTRSIGLRGWSGRRPRFMYWNWSDPLPFLGGLRRMITSRLHRIARRRTRS